jgi:hypothetical protein
MEAAMITTFLVSVAALIIAVLGCAWAKPGDELRTNPERQRETMTELRR